MAKVIMTVTEENGKVVGISFSNAKSVKKMFNKIVDQMEDIESFEDLSELLGIKIDCSTIEKTVKTLNRYYKMTYNEASEEVDYFGKLTTKAKLIDTESMKVVKNFLEAL